MKTDKILFSIIIPTFNRAHLLQDTIKSILGQRTDDMLIELIIVDDGSTDNTELLFGKYGDPRIVYIKVPNQERGAARNRGLAMSRGSYINYFDSDDIFNPCLLQIRDFIMKHQMPDVVFGSIQSISEDGELIEPRKKPYSTFKKNILHNNFLACGSVFLKRQIAIVYLFSEDRKLSGTEDWELWLRIYAEHDFTEMHILIFKQRFHRLRSLVLSNADRVAERELAFISSICTAREMLLRRFNDNEIDLLLADRWSLIALANCEEKKRIQAFKYLLKSIKMSLGVTRRKRFWAVAKNILLK